MKLAISVMFEVSVKSKIYGHVQILDWKKSSYTFFIFNLDLGGLQDKIEKELQQTLDEYLKKLEGIMGTI